jgi:hypothetical protein
MSNEIINEQFIERVLMEYNNFKRWIDEFKDVVYKMPNPTMMTIYQHEKKQFPQPEKIAIFTLIKDYERLIWSKDNITLTDFEILLLDFQYALSNMFEFLAQLFESLKQEVNKQ